MTFYRVILLPPAGHPSPAQGPLLDDRCGGREAEGKTRLRSVARSARHLGKSPSGEFLMTSSEQTLRNI